jgi:hypothetical protein
LDQDYTRCGVLPDNPRNGAVPYVDSHPVKGGLAKQKKTETGRKAGGPVAAGGDNLRNLTWLTAADVKILTLG